MKSFALAAACAVALAAQQDRVLVSRVYHPIDLPPSASDELGGIGPMSGVSTTDLARLDVHVATIVARHALHQSRFHADREELVIVTRGRVRVTIGGRAHDVGPGSVAVLLPGDDHRIENAGAETVTCYVFRYRAKAPADSARGHAAGGSFVVDWDTVTVQPTDVGARRNMFDRATTMYARFEMHVSTLNAGLTNHAAHTHRAEEFVLMLQGDVRMLIGTEREDAHPGDLIFLASQVPHSLDNVGSSAAQYFAFQGQ